MFNNLEEVKRANKDNGYNWFSSDTMSFFASRLVSELDYDTQCFISSEKKCFEDYTRVYAVRQVKADGSIETLVRQLGTVAEAKEYIKRLHNDITASNQDS